METVAKYRFVYVENGCCVVITCYLIGCCITCWLLYRSIYVGEMGHSIVLSVWVTVTSDQRGKGGTIVLLYRSAWGK